jgi:hypothetical protein
VFFRERENEGSWWWAQHSKFFQKDVAFNSGFDKFTAPRR